MAIDKKSFYRYQEHRAQTGYKATLLVREVTDGANTDLYSMICAGETVPAVFGTPDSFEFDLLNSPVKGKVEGKMSLDPVDVEFLLHRDNIWRLHSLKDKVLDFLYLTPDFVGFKFSGTISYRPNEATADVLRGTYTITPMSADPNPVWNARPLVKETLCFKDSIPETIESSNTLDLSMVQDATVTYTINKIKDDGTLDTTGQETVTATDPNKATVTISETGLYAITASASEYASWTTTVYIEQ